MKQHWIVGLALLAACVPSLGAERGPGAMQAPGVRRLAPARASEGASGCCRICGPSQGGRPASAGTHAVGGWRLAPGACTAMDDRALRVRACGLQTVALPELALPGPQPPALPSLGAPAAASPELQSSMTDSVLQDDQEDTLCFLCSRWR